MTTERRRGTLTCCCVRATCMRDACTGHTGHALSFSCVGTCAMHVQATCCLGIVRTCAMHVQGMLCLSTVLAHARHARSTLCPADAKHALPTHGLSPCTRTSDRYDGSSSRSRYFVFSYESSHSLFTHFSLTRLRASSRLDYKIHTY